MRKKVYHDSIFISPDLMCWPCTHSLKCLITATSHRH